MYPIITPESSVHKLISKTETGIIWTVEGQKGSDKSWARHQKVVVQVPSWVEDVPDAAWLVLCKWYRNLPWGKTRRQHLANCAKHRACLQCKVCKLNMWLKMLIHLLTKDDPTTFVLMYRKTLLILCIYKKICFKCGICSLYKKHYG